MELLLGHLFRIEIRENSSGLIFTDLDCFCGIFNWFGLHISRSSTVLTVAMIEQEVESVATDTLTFLKGIEVRSLWEVSHAAVLTVFILHTSAQIWLESLGLSTCILCVSVREFRLSVRGQPSRDNVLWVDWVDHRWFDMVLVMARVDVFRIFVMVMRIDVLRVFLGVDVWFDVAWIVLRAWDTVSTPRMVEDLEIIILRDAQVIVVPNLVERILHWIRPGTPRSESKFELEETCTCILIPDILILPAAGEVVAELRIGHRSVG